MEPRQRACPLTAAKAAGTALADFMDFSAKHGIPPLRYSYEDLEEERRSTDRLEA